MGIYRHDVEKILGDMAEKTPDQGNDFFSANAQDEGGWSILSMHSDSEDDEIQPFSPNEESGSSEEDLSPFESEPVQLETPSQPPVSPALHLDEAPDHFLNETPEPIVEPTQPFRKQAKEAPVTQKTPNKPKPRSLASQAFGPTSEPSLSSIFRRISDRKHGGHLSQSSNTPHLGSVFNRLRK